MVQQAVKNAPAPVASNILTTKHNTTNSYPAGDHCNSLFNSQIQMNYQLNVNRSNTNPNIAQQAPHRNIPFINRNFGVT